MKLTASVQRTTVCSLPETNGQTQEKRMYLNSITLIG